MELDERNLSRQARRKLARAAKRTAKKRQMKKKLFAKRMKSPSKLKSSSEKAAKNLIVKKMLGGKKYSDLSIGQKELIDKKLSAKKGLIAKVGRKLLPKIKKKEKERLKKVRSKTKDINEVVDPLTIASVVALTGGAVAVTTAIAKKLVKVFSRNVDFDVRKTYELIKKKYPGIFKMIKDQRFGKGHLAKMMNDMEDEIPGLKSKKFLYNATNIIDQLMKHHIWNTIGTTNPKLDPSRFKNESTDDGKHGVLTLSVDGSRPEVSARYVNGELKPYVFKTRKEAQKHTKNVGGKSYESAETGLFYVEFTKLDGPVNEKVEYKNANEIKKQWKKQYPNDKFTFKKVRAKGNEWLLVLSPKGVELERYQHVPKTGWIEMNENKDNEEDLKSLKSMLDIAQLLSAQSPYFKARGSKKEYIKMLLHKIKKLSESHEHFLEIIKVPIEIGDTVLGGKFKNKKIVVKKIGKNEKGDLAINGKPLLKVRTIPQKGQMFKETSKKKKKPISKMDAYKQVRKTTMPKSRPMKSKKAYDRKDYKKGKYD